MFWIDLQTAQVHFLLLLFISSVIKQCYKQQQLIFNANTKKSLCVVFGKMIGRPVSVGRNVHVGDVFNETPETWTFMCIYMFSNENTETRDVKAKPLKVGKT